MDSLQGIIDDIVAEMRGHADKGRVADYIAPLARVNPESFGLAVVLADGTVLTGGAADEAFSIQSISKVFTLTLALGVAGDQLW